MENTVPDIQKRIKLLLQRLAAKPNSPALLALAELLLVQGRPAESVRALQSASALYADSYRYYLVLGRAYRAAGKFDAAKAAFESACLLAPQSDIALQELVDTGSSRPADGTEKPPALTASAAAALAQTIVPAASPPKPVTETPIKPSAAALSGIAVLDSAEALRVLKTQNFFTDDADAPPAATDAPALPTVLSGDPSKPETQAASGADAKADTPSALEDKAKLPLQIDRTKLNAALSGVASKVKGDTVQPLTQHSADLPQASLPDAFALPETMTPEEIEALALTMLEPQRFLDTVSPPSPLTELSVAEQPAGISSTPVEQPLTPPMNVDEMTPAQLEQEALTYLKSQGLVDEPLSGNTAETNALLPVEKFVDPFSTPQPSADSNGATPIETPVEKRLNQPEDPDGKLDRDKLAKALASMRKSNTAASSADMDTAAPLSPATPAAPTSPGFDIESLAASLSGIKLKAIEETNDPTPNAEQRQPFSDDDEIPLPTRSLAEIFVAQGAYKKAIKVYAALAESEPVNADFYQQMITELNVLLDTA